MPTATVRVFRMPTEMGFAMNWKCRDARIRMPSTSMYRRLMKTDHAWCLPVWVARIRSPLTTMLALTTMTEPVCLIRQIRICAPMTLTEMATLPYLTCCCCCPRTALPANNQDVPSTTGRDFLGRFFPYRNPVICSNANGM